MILCADRPKIYKLLVEHLILHETPGGSHRQSNLSQVDSSTRSIGLHLTHGQMRLQRRQPGFCISMILQFFLSFPFFRQR